MAIVTAGDTNFTRFLIASTESAKALHPGEYFVIYDYGLKEEDKSEIMKVNGDTFIIPWEFVPIPGKENLSKKEYILCQKPFSMLHFMQTFMENFLFLDGDAYLLNSVPELLYHSYDAIITLRPKKDRVFTKNKCRVVNSGVLSVGSEWFLEEWIQEMKVLEESYLVEQTALTRLVYKNDKLNVKKVGCEIYNYYWPKAPRDEVKIIHYKGQRRKNGDR